MTPMEQQRRLSSSSLYMQHTHNNETFVTKERSIMQSVDMQYTEERTCSWGGVTSFQTDVIAELSLNDK